MAEPRRVNLMPVEAPVVGKKDKKQSRASRFSLTLTESNDKSCPEFSYADLLKNSLEKKKEEKAKQKLEKNRDHGDDPFGSEDDEEDEQLKALARALEEKYGPKPGKKSKKQRFDRIEDLVDLGDGYDETDAFIDNSEAYDELVPACMTTRHGGFYINSGKLDFRFYSDVDSDDDFDALQNKRKKKIQNKIGSDSEGEVVVVKRGRPKKRPDHGDLKREKKRKKKFMSISDSERTYKKTKFDKGPRPKKPSGGDGGPAAGSVATPQQNGIPPSTSSAAAAAAASEPVSSPQLILLDDSDDSLSDSDSQKPSTSSAGDLTSKFNSNSDSPHGKPTKSESPDESRSFSPCPESAPDLPDGLPPIMLERITKLKLAAKQSKEGKCKFFSGEVNTILLHIENSSRSLVSRRRLALYSHLVAFLPCGMQTLMKRAKNLRLNQQDDKLRQPMEKLREAIQRVMPALIEKHQIETANVLQAKQEKLLEGKVKDGISSDSEDDGEKGDKRKGPRGPRKKFEWSSEMRSLVCDIVRIKMESYEVSKVRSQSPDEYLRSFLDAEVRPLWPQGWIQTRMLFKESRAIHGRWTVYPNKPKKSMLITKNTTPTSSLPNSGTSTPTQTVTKSNPLAVVTPTTMPVVKKEDITVSNTSSPLLTSTKKEHKVEAATVIPSPTLLDYAGESYASYAKSKVSGVADSGCDGVLSMGVTTSTPISASGGGSSKPSQSSLLAKALVTDELLQPVSEHPLQSHGMLTSPSTPKSVSNKQRASNSDFFKKFEEFARTPCSISEESFTRTATAPVAVTTSITSSWSKPAAVSTTVSNSAMLLATSTASSRTVTGSAVHDLSKKTIARPFATTASGGNGSHKSTVSKISVGSKHLTALQNKHAAGTATQLDSDTTARNLSTTPPNNSVHATVPAKVVKQPMLGAATSSSLSQASVKHPSPASAAVSSHSSALHKHLTLPLTVGIGSAINLTSTHYPEPKKKKVPTATLR